MLSRRFKVSVKLGRVCIAGVRIGNTGIQVWL